MKKWGFTMKGMQKIDETSPRYNEYKAKFSKLQEDWRLEEESVDMNLPRNEICKTMDEIEKKYIAKFKKMREEYADCYKSVENV